MLRCETKSLPLLLLLALLPVRTPAAAAAAEAIPVPSPVEAPRIRIVPHLDPAGRARRAEEKATRRAALRPALDLWCRAYIPAARPLRASLGEAWDSLERGWGPASRNLGYPVREALRPLAALPPLPDPRLDRQLRQALLYIKEGAQACTKGMPMTARLRWGTGLQQLAEVEASLAAGAGECAFPAAASFTVVVGEEVGDPYASGGGSGSAAAAAPPTKKGAPGSPQDSGTARTRTPRGSQKHSPRQGRPPRR
ncbi:MAG TPA: hypothetical protein VFE33_23450 [Thermoanaerobaculia bacterium]|nr:hypothetical protein [Thermoanaerobaculia bacterium]